MKRYLALTLVLSLCLGLFAACGKTEETKQTEEPEKEEVDMFANSMQKSDPSQDDTYNLLLVGSSAFVYQMEEIVGMAKAAGIKMVICDLYYDGCRLKWHCDWLASGENKYKMYYVDENGRTVT